MPSFRDVRNAVLHAHALGNIDDEEFLILYEEFTTKNLEFPYWKYDAFNLENMTDDECWSEFRFRKNDIHRLRQALRIPDSIVTYNRLRVDGDEALCIYLRRYSYPNLYSDLLPRFPRPVGELCIISYHILDHIYDNFAELLQDFNPQTNPILQPGKLEVYCQAIADKGSPLTHCFGFLDGTIQRISRPGKNQRQVYNGHKRVHSLKYQSLVLPNGLIANLFGPIEGRRHDCAMLTMSNLLPSLTTYAKDTNGADLCVYSDLGYPIRPQLHTGFKNLGNLTPQQTEYNKRMSALRIVVEWLFGDIANYYAFLDFKKKHKLYGGPIGKMYICCALLANAKTCLYGNGTSEYFALDPPTIEEYFV